MNNRKDNNILPEKALENIVGGADLSWEWQCFRLRFWKNLLRILFRADIDESHLWPDVLDMM